MEVGVQECRSGLKKMQGRLGTVVSDQKHVKKSDKRVEVNKSVKKYGKYSKMSENGRQASKWAEGLEHSWGRVDVQSRTWIW